MGLTSKDLGAALRQWRQPREFRIRASGWPADVQAGLVEIVKILKEPRELPAPSVPGGPAVLPGLGAKELAEVVTNLWRLSKRMPASAGRAARHLEAVWDALAQVGVEVQEHEGKPFDRGLRLKVLSVEAKPELSREQVIETIRPSIYLKDETIQMGEVIVGSPEPAVG